MTDDDGHPVVIRAAAIADLKGLSKPVRSELLDLMEALQVECDPTNPRNVDLSVCICYPVAPRWFRAKRWRGRGRLVFSVWRDGIEVEPHEPVQPGDTIAVEFCAERNDKTYYDGRLKARVG